jgi:Na+-transporting methylmalonyl-CoA/oxaloacetate decarboxylase beta subunit
MRIKRIMIFLVTCFSAAICLMNAVLYFFLPLYLDHKFSADITHAGSVEIIGKAEGPVIIFIAGAMDSFLFIVIPIIITVAGIAYFIVTKKDKINI